MRVYHLTNEEIEHQRQRSIVQQQIEIERQQREIDALILTLAIRDNDYAEARRENDALRARLARATRKPVPWHVLALAWLIYRLEALDRWIKAWWL